MPLILKRAAVAAALVAGTAAAIAGPINIGGSVILEDDNIEYATDASGNLKTSGSLAVGDTLWAVVTFTAVKNAVTNATIQQLRGDSGSNSLVELKGISAITVTSIDATTNTAFFGANPTFAATYGAGALAALFTKAAPGSFSTSCNTISIAACEAQAVDGDPWLVAGLEDADDFWSASGVAPFNITTDLSLVAATPGVTKVAVANYGLSVLQNNTGFALNSQACALCSIYFGASSDGQADLIGSGDILGGFGLANGFIARSDFDFQLNGVPEPATLGLVGLALAGLGVASRRRKSA